MNVGKLLGRIKEEASASRVSCDFLYDAPNVVAQVRVNDVDYCVETRLDDFLSKMGWGGVEDVITDLRATGTFAIASELDSRCKILGRELQKALNRIVTLERMNRRQEKVTP